MCMGSPSPVPAPKVEAPPPAPPQPQKTAQTVQKATKVQNQETQDKSKGLTLKDLIIPLDTKIGGVNGGAAKIPK